MSLARTASGFAQADRKLRHLLKLDRETRYEVGVVLIDIRDGGELGAAGFKSFTAYLRTVAAAEGVTVRTLQNHVDFAASVPRQVVENYGSDWIAYALDLLPPDKDGNVLMSMHALETAKVSVERKGKKTLVPFSKATVDELAAAYAEKHRLALPGHTLDRDRSHVAERLGDGIEVTQRRRKKVTGLGIFVPADKVAAFLKKLK